MTDIVSVVIPSRNEKYLQKTIQDLLLKATQEIEIIAVLDGYWSPVKEIVNNPKVNYIHFSESKGMRNAINSAVSVANGKYILKIDAHCMFNKGFDGVLKADCQDNWIIIPRRYALDPDKWEIINNPKYPVDYMYLSSDLHGVIWDDKNKDPGLKGRLIDDVMSSQGSCWFIKKDYFNFLELEDEENYGRFWNEFQEVGLKCWLSGGSVKVNKKTWYAHWHKPGDVGRGYPLGRTDGEKAVAFTKRWLTQKNWHKQIYKLKWLVNKFAPIPTWR
jgi:glycosyltransferase involved in cell wall biosynthesis